MIKRIINRIWEVRVTFLYKKKLRKIANNVCCSKSNMSFLETEFKRKWSSISKGCSVLYLKCFSSINGIASSEYVPENIYYNKIEPILNDKSFALAYSDKNFYEHYLREFKALFPKTLLRGINGVFLDNNFKKISLIDDISNFFNEKDCFILKPATETSGGDNVVSLTKKNNGLIVNDQPLRNSEFIHLLKHKYNGSFVIQELIHQHNWFSDFNHSSLNTVRLFTYRSVLDEQIHSIHAVVRFGQKGHLVDNQSSGGLSCGINNRGLLNKFAVDKYGKRYDHIHSVIKKANTSVPGLNEMKIVASVIASYYYYHRLLGFDFCYDKTNNIRLLEINCKNIETNFLQMNNGPLFGKFTDEVITYCSKNKKSLIFDFYV